MKAEKCEFHAPSVSFLGYIIAKDNLRMDPDKVSAVTSRAPPETRKQLQRYLGFGNIYRSFIRGFSSIASPLSALTSPKVPFRWSNEAQNTFETLKTRFTTAPILQIPEPNRLFIVEVDASVVGVEANLSQRSSICQKIRPCAFLSRHLTPSERN